MNGKNGSTSACYRSSSASKGRKASTSIAASWSTSMSARNSGQGLSRLQRKLLGGVLFCLLGGCAVGPDFVRPEAPPVTHYANGGDPTVTAAVKGTAQQFNVGAEVAADWWHLFESP